MKKLIILGATSALVACGGGSDSSAGSAGASIQGVAAVGAPLVKASVTVTDSTGKECLPTGVLTNTDGYYMADTNQCLPPLLIKATDVNNKTWESISMSNQGLINITPLTKIIATSALGGNLGAFVEMSADRAALQGKIMAAKATLVASLAKGNIFLDDGFDLVHSAFVADHKGFDAILDKISVTQDAGVLTVKDATGSPLFTIAATGIIEDSNVSPGLWPDYSVFNSLGSSTIKDLNPDDVATYSLSDTGGKFTFAKGTHEPITVTGKFGDGFASLLDQSGNERLESRIMTICAASTHYVMLSKGVTLVPLSELTGGARKELEFLEVNQASCPVSGIAPLTTVFTGNDGPVVTPDGGEIAASEFKQSNSRPDERFLGFKVMVGGAWRYGMVDRGLDGNSPFLAVHVQKTSIN